MPLEHRPALTDEQHRQFEASGWVVARGFFDGAEAARIATWVEDLRAKPEKPGEHMVYREDDLRRPGERIVQRIEYFCDFDDRLGALVEGRLKTAVGELLGGPAVLFKEKINLKLPGGGGFEAHQDQQAGWSAYAPLFVTAVVAIDRATAENGCLEMAVGPRLTALAGEEWRPLTPEEVAETRYEPVPTDPGDVLFFDSYAAHRSKANLTEAPRRLLYLTYNRASDGDQRARYFADKRASFPPDIERKPGETHRFRV